MRWKALAEIYKMHSFALFSWDPSGEEIYENKLFKLDFCLKIVEICQTLPNFIELNFVKISLELVDFRADFYRNFTKSCRIKKEFSDICGKL